MDRFDHTRLPDWDWWGKLWPAPGETLRSLGISPGTSLAEIGSGDGYFALPAARITDPAPVYAVDVDESLLDGLATLAEKQGIDNVVPVHGDARALEECLPEPVDTALIANTFHGIEDPRGFVEQVGPVVAAGGQFVVVNWRDRPRESTTVAGEPRGPPTESRLSSAETRELVESAGTWALARQVDLPPYHYALVFDD